VPKWVGVTCSGGVAPAVTEIILGRSSSGVAGQIGTLAPLAADLTRLNLADTDAAGDVAGLAPLVKLTFLSLFNPKVTGEAAALAPLSRLTWLDLHGYEDGADTKFEHVAGQIGTLAPLAADLTRLDLSNTDAAGDVAGLAPLVRLTYLSLEHTKVTGQAAGLAPLTRLTTIDLSGTAVAGCGAFCGAAGPFHSHCDPHPDPTYGCNCYCSAHAG
jgi:hypothetical protein